jgi:hypothetical protein
LSENKIDGPRFDQAGEVMVGQRELVRDLMQVRKVQTSPRDHDVVRVEMAPMEVRIALERRTLFLHRWYVSEQKIPDVCRALLVADPFADFEIPPAHLLDDFPAVRAAKPPYQNVQNDLSEIRAECVQDLR